MLIKAKLVKLPVPQVILYMFLSIPTLKKTSHNLQLKTRWQAVTYMQYIKLGRHPSQAALNIQEHA